MRPKKLIVQGFKSFADRTEFVFDAPIVGIVGPNGCGKSNVVDAFKWVLGEQSAKSLRGDAMMDVIFNGSSARKPSGMAEVVLVFDNPRRPDGSRMLQLDADEVAVSRRLFRDGTSEYQVNNQSARLKDIREMFLDTGVGVDAYSVIEQGKVAAMLDANPQERRFIFEEAAGISKFKQKKKEAQRKLEKVDQNLLRVKDIVDEVDRRLRSVRIQAGRARTFREHSERLRELRLKYALQEYFTFHGQLEEHVSAQGIASSQLEKVEADLAGKQLDLGQTRQRYDDLSERKQRAEYELVQTQAALQSSRQKQHYARQQIEQIAEQLQQCEADRENLQAKSAEVQAQLARDQQLLTELTAQMSAHRREIEQKQNAFHDTQLEQNDINRQIEQNKAAILDLMRRSAQLANRLGAIEIERKNIANHQQRLGQRRQVVIGELEALEAARAELQSQLSETQQELTDLHGQMEECVEDSAALGKQIEERSAQLGAAREHRSGLLSRQRLLEDLEAKREGFTEGVKSILRQRAEKFPFVRGVVADVLRVDVEHAMIIEAALDGRDQMLIADSSAAVTACPELQELEGRVNVLCTDKLCAPTNTSTDGDGLPQTIEESNILPFGPTDKQVLKQLLTDVAARYDWNQHPQRIRLAVDMVKFEPGDAPLAHHLLGRTIVVDTLPDAEALQDSALAGFRFVTMAGEVLESDGTIRVGPLTAAMGLISRRAELEALNMQIADVDRRIEELTGQVTAGNEQARALQERQKQLQNSIYQLNTRKVETNSRLAQNNDKQSSLRREVPVLEKELQNFLDQFGRLKSEESTLLEKRQQAESEQQQREQHVTELTQKQAEAGERLKQAGEALTTLRVQLGQIQEKQIAAQQAVQRLTATATELGQQLERVARTAEQVSSRRGAVEDELAAAVEQEQDLVDKQQKVEKAIEVLTVEVKELDGKVSALQAEADEVAAQQATITQELHQLEIRVGEVRVRLEGLVQRTMEELQLDLPARWQEVEQQGGYQPADIDWSTVAEEIRQLKEKIQRLGNVNLDAIGEQDELEQRQTFLSTQVTDLTSSKLQLEQLIDEINKESSVRFEQTFNTVREHFQGMFRKLFGGGKADIFLETSVDEPSDQQPVIGPDGQTVLPIVKKIIDPLEAGIEIMAHPPGKKPVSISQLSGGEKTMTCVALLMSIFKSKPSPFCILDEVDAALDEANNQRFNLIVQEFLEQSQFIVITHSKRTMQIADMLYGVTMQEQGVSRRVAVKFDQVDNQGRIAPVAEAAAA
ncbi:MAG: AAA family ATPase [Tepidisphaeraceae bacterium]